VSLLKTTSNLIDQPDECNSPLGIRFYSLIKKEDLLKRKMSDCTGIELLQELL